MFRFRQPLRQMAASLPLLCVLGPASHSAAQEQPPPEPSDAPEALAPTTSLLEADAAPTPPEPESVAPDSEPNKPEPEPPPEAEATDAAFLSAKPLRIDLDEDGDRWLRIVTWHQLWARAMQMNPGTEVAGEPETWVNDAGIRRSRVIFFGQIVPRVQFLLHFGINNQTFTGGLKPQLFIHGVWGQVDVVPGALTLGTGLHYWNGPSRLANASTLNQLALDLPIVNWPIIDRVDQFGRQLGLFAKGQIGAFDYRVALNKPFARSDELAPGGPVGYASESSLALAGYFQWQFLDLESNALPYAVGTYLGTKRVLNLGLGFHWEPDAMARLSPDETRQDHDIVLLAGDIFADIPTGGGSAFTGYLGYYYYDLGPDHLRNVGIMNPGSGGTSFAGGGNAYPLIGTGHHIVSQLGFLLPGRILGIQLQPYAALQLSAMDALDDPMLMLEGGLNWLLSGHNAKVTTHYRSRPVFQASGGDVTASERASELIMQLQVLL